jgi:hypothetical protein
MNRLLCGGVIVLGLFGVVMIAGTAGTQPASSAEDAGKYSGLSGSQALQEQMYEARMKEILGEEAQGGQQSQGMGDQKGMKGAEESSQKMQGQPGMKGSSPGDQTIEEQKSRGKK